MRSPAIATDPFARQQFFGIRNHQVGDRLVRHWWLLRLSRTPREIHGGVRR
jgi:hypothetical protein